MLSRSFAVARHALVCRAIPGFLASLVLAFTAASCASDLTSENPFDPGAPSTTQQKATLSGCIRLELGGDDLSGSRAALAERPDLAAETGPDGCYSIGDIPAGTYDVVLSRAGYRSETVNGVDLRIGDTRAIADVTLTLGRGAIAGQVRLAGGDEASAAGVTVQATPTSGPGQGAVTLSISDGSFRLEGIVEGTYTLTAAFGGYAPAEITGVSATDGGITTLEEPLVLVVVDEVLLINDGATFSASRDVELTVDNQGARQMRFGEAPVLDDVAWIDVVPSVDYELTGAGDGLKTVYIQFRDSFDQESAVFSAEITLDTTPPAVTSLRVDGGAAFSNDAAGALTLSVEAEDLLSGLGTLSISENGGAFSEPQPFSPTLVYAITDAGTDGPRELRLRVTDGAGNQTPDGEEATATITFDRLAPQNPAVEILARDSDDVLSVTSERVVRARVTVEGAVALALREGAVDCVNQNYQPLPAEPVAFTFSETDGQKTLRACFRDEAGNTSFADADVALDTLGPESPNVSVREGQVVGSANVTLELFAVGATRVLVSQDDPRFAEPLDIAYTTELAYTLTTDDGPTVIYVRFFDDAGNPSETVFDQVLLQSSPPDAGLVVDLDAVYANDPTRNVTLLFFAQPAPELARASEFEDFRDAAYIPYTEQREFTLSAGDGEKTIYAQFRAFGGQESRVVSDSIILDTTLREAGCSAGQGGFTAARDVTLRFDTPDRDIASARVGFQRNLDGSVFEAVDPLAPTLPVTLPGADGPKLIYFALRDGAGNESPEVRSCRVTLDTAPPDVATLEIGGGLEFTNRREVVLSLFAEDRNGVERILLSNTPDFENPEEQPYSTNISWLLSPGEGPKTVFARFLDPAGNFTEVQDEITLDPNRPDPGSVRIAEGDYVQNTVVTLEVESTDATEIEITGDVLGAGTGTGNWQLLAPATLVNLVPAEGPKLINVTFRSPDGLLGAVQVRTTLDLNPPALNLVRILGTSLDGEDDGLTNSADVLVQALGADGLGSGISEISISNRADFLDAGYVPLEGDTVSWTLDPPVRAIEERILFVRVRDRSGRQSQPRSARITLDSQAPESLWVDIRAVRGAGEVTLEWTFEGDILDIAAFDIEVRDAETSAVVLNDRIRVRDVDIEALGGGVIRVRRRVLPLAAGGTFALRVRALDAAGNASAESPAAIGRVAGDDEDGDGVPFAEDNCPDQPNPPNPETGLQDDEDGDGLGDVCDGLDLDNDGLFNELDNCPEVPNADQRDFDGDGDGDACDDDTDNDGYTDADEDTANQSNPLDPSDRPLDTDGDFISDRNDNCPTIENPDQANFDNDAEGDPCDDDDDNDGYLDADELSGDQSDPLDAGSAPPDQDRDSVSDLNDNCPDLRNTDQADFDEDGDGDACDDDDDNDGFTDEDERGSEQADPFDPTRTPPDGDGDFVSNSNDNCQETANPDQLNNDGDAFGDACDDDDDNDGFKDEDELIEIDGQPQSDPFNAGSRPSDIDGDFVSDLGDNCPEIFNDDQANFDDDLQGNACDIDQDNDAVDDQTERLAGTDFRDPEDFPLPSLEVVGITTGAVVPQGRGQVPLQVTVQNTGILDVSGIIGSLSFEYLDAQGLPAGDGGADYTVNAVAGGALILPDGQQTTLSFFIDVSGDARKGSVRIGAVVTGVAGIGGVLPVQGTGAGATRTWSVEESEPEFVRITTGADAGLERSVVLTPGDILNVAVEATDVDGTVPLLSATMRNRSGVAIDPSLYDFADNEDGTGSLFFAHDPENPVLGSAQSPFRVIFRATDFEDIDTTSDWLLYVALEQINAPPVFEPFVDTHVIGEREPLTFVVNAIDPEGDMPELSAFDLPANASFTDNRDGSGTFTFLPDREQGGEDEITYTIRLEARDSVETDLATDELVTITVQNRPFIEPIGESFPALEEQRFSLRVDARDPAGFHPSLRLAETPDSVELTGQLEFTDNGDGTGAFAFTPVDGDARDDGYAFRVEAFDARGGVFSRSFEVVVARLAPNDLVFLGVTEIGADDRSFDDQDILIQGGEVTIDGPHTFKNLIIRDGGVLTHSPFTPNPASPEPYDPGQVLEIKVTGVISIEAGGAIDVSGLGFAGAPNGLLAGQGFTVGNTRDNGSAGLDDGVRAAGGSHGGLGGSSGDLTAGPRYGSPIDPNQPGSGGGRGSFSAGGGGAGGGVVRLFARVIDIAGAIRADGADGEGDSVALGGGGGGAGGSILLAPLPLEDGGDGVTLEILGPTSGSATITANGGQGGNSASTGTAGAGGGGGRVAIHHSSLASNITLNAYAGSTINSFSVPTGAHGTVFVRNTAFADGVLRLQRNTSITSNGVVRLAGAGPLTVAEVAGATLRFAEGSLPVVNGDDLLRDAWFAPVAGGPARFRIRSHDDSSAVLDATPEALVAAGIEAGSQVVDSWVLRNIQDAGTDSSPPQAYTDARIQLTGPSGLIGESFDRRFLFLRAHSLHVDGAAEVVIQRSDYRLQDTFISDRPLRRIRVTDFGRFDADYIEADEIEVSFNSTAVQGDMVGTVFTLSNSSTGYARNIDVETLLLRGSTLRPRSTLVDLVRVLEVNARDIVIDNSARIYAAFEGFRGSEDYESNLGAGFGNVDRHDGPGCHGGEAVYQATIPCVPYGNVYWPRLPGAGGGRGTNNGRGGGAVQLHVSGSLQLDGQIQAWSDGSGGAGGSVLLDMMGSGVFLIPDGGATINVNGNGTGGGGGRIAIVDFVGPFPDGLTTSAFPPSSWEAGPGTIFVREATSDFGDLTVDANNANTAGRGAVLTPLGGGSVTAVVGNTLTVTRDSGEPLPLDDIAAGSDGLVRRWIQVVDDEGGLLLARVVSNTADSMTVRAPAAASIDSRVSVGARWNGAYPFRSVTTRRNAALKSEDRLLVFGITPGEVPGEHVVDGGFDGALGFPPDMTSLRIRNGFYPNLDPAAFPPIVTIEDATVEMLAPIDVEELNIVGEGSLRAAPRDDDDNPRPLVVNAARVTVDEGATIDADTRGYRGREASAGEAPEGFAAAGEGETGSNLDEGGSHGGVGERRTGVGLGEVYGDYRFPDEFGGSGGTDSTFCRAGHGGGKVVLRVSESLTVNGRVGADGDGPCDSGGAGGAVRVELSNGATLAGSGSVTARGGAGTYEGGGGRIAVLRYGGELPENLTFDARGGTNGSQGTIYLEPALGLGDLVLYDKTSNTIPLSRVELPRDRTVTAFVGAVLSVDGEPLPEPNSLTGAPGLVGHAALLELLDGGFETYAIVDNDAGTLTVDLGEDTPAALEEIDRLQIIARFDEVSVDTEARFTFEPGFTARSVSVTAGVSSGPRGCSPTR